MMKLDESTMKYINLPDRRQRKVSFYLAMEEYVAQHIAEPECFFMWQVEPSVVFGRNQIVEKEVNLDFCRKHGIQLFRRKSGGGCVYADSRNAMFSCVTDETVDGLSFRKYMGLLVVMLRRLGVPAEASGRNDILVQGRKVSGNAFYRMPATGKSVVHGTMLYDVDILNMVGAITPTDAKLLCKGMADVRQRVAMLKDCLPLSLPEFMDFVKGNIGDGEMTLTSDDVKAIEEMEQAYQNEDFIFGHLPQPAVSKSLYVEKVGELEARIDLTDGVIDDWVLLGDFFILDDIDEAIIRPLVGKRLSKEAVEEALPADLSSVVMNLKRDDIVRLLVG